MRSFFLFDRNYILNYLATRLNLENFVVQALVTVLAKITKYGWFYSHKDELVFRSIVEDVRKFLQVRIGLNGYLLFDMYSNLSAIFFHIHSTMTIIYRVPSNIV